MVVFGPTWFSGLDIEFQLIFTLITLGIAAYAHRLARIANNKNYFVFSAGFLLMSAAYGVRTLFNLAMYVGALPTYHNLTTDWVQFAGFYMSSILFLGGLALLLSTAFKVRDIRPTVMVYLIAIIGFLMSSDRPVILFIYSVLFLSMICYHHAKNFWHTGNSTAFMVLFSFGMILLGQFNFLFRYSSIFYVLGHIAELVGYVVLLLAMLKIARK